MTAPRPAVTFRCLTISASPGRVSTAPWSDGARHCYAYTVTIRSDATNVRRRFTFYASTADYDAGRRGLGGFDLLEAFRCFVSDAAAGQESFADFAAEYGYDQDSYAARRIHEGCRAAARKFDDLWHTPTEPADVLAQLAAEGIE